MKIYLEDYGIVVENFNRMKSFRCNNYDVTTFQEKILEADILSTLTFEYVNNFEVWILWLDYGRVFIVTFDCDCFNRISFAQERFRLTERRIRMTVLNFCK